MPDLTRTPGAGATYARSTVEVTCSDDDLRVSSNGMPSYNFVAKTPNALAEQDWEWTVPRRPNVAAQPTSIVNRLGTLGFTVTGLPIYGPTEGPQPAREAFGDPVVNKVLDDCMGHTGPRSEYHNHALVDSSACGFGPSPILGYALDGFPIYGPRGCLDRECNDVVTFESGYVSIGDATSNAWKAYEWRADDRVTTLDVCNGRIGPDGSYRYHATSQFPYTFGCFAGTPTEPQGRAAGPMPPM